MRAVIYRLIKLNITVCNHDYILKTIKKRIIDKKNCLISPISAYECAFSFLNYKLLKSFRKYNLLFPDGVWIIKAINFLYNSNFKNNSRIRGTDLMLKVCEMAEKEKYKIFLYGTVGKTLFELEKNLIKSYPKLKIKGCLPAPEEYDSLSFSRRHDESFKLLEKMENLKINILFIAIGAPNQYILAENLIKDKYKNKSSLIVIPVGAGFDFISGVKSQAPKRFQDLGFEWLYRLIREPTRLWKRYIIYGSLFMMLVVAQKFSVMKD